jgi:hypothetical protein
MELTWLLYQNGKQIAYNADTFYFAGEPEIFRLLSKNSISDGYRVFSNLKLKCNNIMKISHVKRIVIVGLADTFVGNIFYVAITYLAISYHDPLSYILSGIGYPTVHTFILVRC